MATPVKKDFDHFQETCVFVPTAREEELLSRTVHPEEFRETIQNLVNLIGIERDRRETLEVRFNMLCNMLNVQLANSGFLTLKIMEAKK